MCRKKIFHHFQPGFFSLSDSLRSGDRPTSLPRTLAGGNSSRYRFASSYPQRNSTAQRERIHNSSTREIHPHTPHRPPRTADHPEPHRPATITRHPRMGVKRPGHSPRPTNGSPVKGKGHTTDRPERGRLRATGPQSPRSSLGGSDRHQRPGGSPGCASRGGGCWGAGDHHRQIGYDARLGKNGRLHSFSSSPSSSSANEITVTDAPFFRRRLAIG